MYTVFVYGTLRTRGSAESYLKSARSLGAATMFAKLYRVHEEFPGIIIDPKKESTIIGEVFSNVSAKLLKYLDEYEGCDTQTPLSKHLYRRITAQCYLSEGNSIEAFAYEYINEVTEKNRIYSGDWLSYLSSIED